MKASGREAPQRHQRFPLRRLIAEIARPIRDLKLTGQTERAEALIDVLKTIHRLRFPAENSTSIPSEASASALPPDDPESLRPLAGT